jgi:poly-beta-1,6-N-acetyl-D-glucosamine synthase
MDILAVFFWISLAIILYSYLGYGLLLWLLLRIKKIFKPKIAKFYKSTDELPTITFLVAAYNEEDFMLEKIKNTFDLEYPSDKFKFMIVTDGSTDRTPQIIKKFKEIRLLHEPMRRGKISAVHRAMAEVNADLVIFSDANTLLNPDAAFNLARHFKDKNVGAVAGEKRIISKKQDAASGAGEGIYWMYESKLKQWDSAFNTVVGAAGELFAIRTKLYEKIQPDTIIEDFYITLRIAKKGYRVAYEPGAYAIEGPSESVKEEMKRKIRIAAGGLQAISRLLALLNIFRYGWLSFQYISHRVLRWTLAPIALVLVFIFNAILAVKFAGLYYILFLLQLLFYILSLIGFLLQFKKIKIKIFFIPYYFFIMNLCVFLGFFRFLKKSQPVTWERAKRG